MSSDPIFDKPDPALSLTEFLRSSAVMHAQYTTQDDPKEPPPQPHEVLASIIDDERWTRRMLEDWFKGGIMRQRGGSIIPEPEFRALYLVLLARLLEREKKQERREEEEKRAEEVETEKAEEEERKAEKIRKKEKQQQQQQQHGEHGEEMVEH